MTTGTLAEAEIKLEITREEFGCVTETLSTLKLELSGTERLCDYYLEFERGALGGWNFSRLRVIDNARYVLTRKHWVADGAGQPVRLEDECEITVEEADALLYPMLQPLSLEKTRTTYTGKVDGTNATIALDRLVLDGESFFFLEVEVMTLPDQAQAARERLLAWVHATLPVKATHEARSMLELLLDRMQSDHTRQSGNS